VFGNRESRGEAVGTENNLAAAQKKQPIPACFRRDGLQLTDPVHENLSFQCDDPLPLGVASLQFWRMKVVLQRNDPRHPAQHCIADCGG
jgi:hypothetical protein